MFYLPQAIAAWVAAIWFIEWKRLRELITYGLYASFVCAVEDRLGFMYGLWEYRDSGPINTHTEISILIGLSAAPLFGMYFVQGLKRRSGVPLGRILAITITAMVPETVGLYTGHILHGNWWHYGFSVLAHCSSGLASTAFTPGSDLQRPATYRKQNERTLGVRSFCPVSGNNGS